MKELLKKTAALWIAVVIVLTVVCLPPHFTAKAADSGSAYLTVELLPLNGLQKGEELHPLGKGFLCTPSKIGIVSGETAAQTLMRFLAEKGYSVLYAGSEKKDASGKEAGYTLGYIADGDLKKPVEGYVSSLKDYQVKDAKKIEITGELPALAEAIFKTYGVKWDPEKDKLNVKETIGAKTLSDDAGWVFSLNNEYVTAPLSEVTLKDGDVLRIQFSFAGGKDLGYSFLNDGTVKTNTADRSKLIRLVADYENNHAGSKVYDEVCASLGKMTLSVEELTRLYGGLWRELRTLGLIPDETQPTTPPTTVPPTTQPTTQPTTLPPTTQPTTQPPTTQPPTTRPPTTQPPTTRVPATQPAPQQSTTKAPATQPATTKASVPTTRASSLTTRAPVRVYTTAPNRSTTLQTTVLETTTILRPEGIVLQHVNKEVPTTEEATTAPEETEEETTQAAQTFVEKLQQLRYADGPVRWIIIAAAVLVLVIAAAIIIRKRAKKR